MIPSMILVYSTDEAGSAMDSAVMSMKAAVLRHWNEERDSAGAVSNCFGVSNAAYKNLAAVGLKEKATDKILHAVSSSIGQRNLQNHVEETARVAARLGLQGCTLRVTEFDHPDGFPFLAIGFDAT